MGTFSNARVHYGLQITGTPTKKNVVGDQLVGVGPTTATIANGAGFSTSAIIGANGGTATCFIVTNNWTLTTPTAQVETATAAGTITASGNATVVVTGTRITGSPVTLSVPVLNGDTADAWATKVRTALSSNTAISSVYTVGGTSTAITLTETTAVYGNDGTLNISLANGTCTGITTAATSANTTAGVAGSIVTNNTGDAKDFEGVNFEVAASEAVLIQCTAGSLTAAFTQTLASIPLTAGKFALITGLESEDEIEFTAGANDTRFTLTAIGTTVA